MSNSTFIKLLIRSSLYTLAMLFVWFCLNNFINGSVWNGMTISKSALTAEYCEFNNGEKLFHQRMNTYSNLAYFFFGVLVLQIAYEDYKNRKLSSLNRLEKFPLLSAVMGICFIYLSFGSAFFHASLTWAGQRVDMNGTYGISLTLLWIGFYQVLYKIDFTEDTKRRLIISLLILIFAFYQIALLVSSSVLIPIIILVQLILVLINYFQFRKERSILIGILSFVLILIAIKIRTLDVQKINCDPSSFYQGHAVWHLLTAFSSFLFYAFFRFKKVFF